MHFIVYSALVLSMMIIVQFSNVDAECCKEFSVGAWSYSGEHCGPWCCGCGACNIFCCNCDSGCNQQWTKYWNGYGYNYPYTCGHWNKKRKITGLTFRNASLEAKVLFKSIDTNKNNAISNTEAAIYLENSGKFKRSTTFSIHNELRKMDINNDGKISRHEFDDSL